MTRWCGVISEREHEQRRCLHQLEKLDPKKEHGFKWRCRKCGAFLYRRNGVVVKNGVSA